MYREILVPLDGSLMSESAVATAADIARRSGARLHIVEVSGALEADYTDSRFGTKNHLDTLAARCSSTLGVETITEVLFDPVTGVDDPTPPSPIVTKVLRSYVKARDIDLIVMTTHGRGGFMRAWLGSVADEMLRTTSTPILTLKPIGRVMRPRPAVLAQRILIPIDMSDRDQELIARTVEFGELYNAEYTFIHVVQPVMVALAGVGGDAYMEAGPSLVDSAHAYLDRLADAVIQMGHRVRVEVTSMPFVASEIIAYADSHQFDLVSVATRGHSPLGRALMGSVADKILRGASMPVLVNHLAGAAEDESKAE